MSYYCPYSDIDYCYENYTSCVFCHKIVLIENINMLNAYWTCNECNPPS